MKKRIRIYVTITIVAVIVLSIEALILSHLVAHDGSETLFGIVPVPKWEHY